MRRQQFPVLLSQDERAKLGTLAERAGVHCAEWMRGTALVAWRYRTEIRRIAKQHGVDEIDAIGIAIRAAAK